MKFLNETFSMKVFLLQISQYFPKSFRSFGENINVKIDLSNYGTKTNYGMKTNLVNLKTEDDKSDIDKLVPVHVGLSKLSDVIKNDVVKRTVYDKLVANVNNIDTNDLVLKTKYKTDKTELEKKIPDVTDFVKEAKLTELENTIPDISNLSTKTALTAAENKKPSVSGLVKKTDYNRRLEIDGSIGIQNPVVIF